VRYLDWGHLALAMGLLAFALGWGRKAATQPAVRAANGTSARESA
jgi:hypothetical protein